MAKKKIIKITIEEVDEDSHLNLPTINIPTERGCLWDSMPETSPGSGMKIGQLACPCPKCAVWC